MTIIAGTGHRPDKLGGYSVEVSHRLRDLARAAILRYEPGIVVSGMALGWDLALAEAAVELGVPWWAAVPFEGQEGIWPKASQRRYRQVLNQATRRFVLQGPLSEREEIRVALDARNRWMVDHSSALFTLHNGSRGGTHNCIEYALERKKLLIPLWKSWVKHR